jgi:hypothetical protein
MRLKKEEELGGGGVDSNIILKVCDTENEADIGENNGEEDVRISIVWRERGSARRGCRKIGLWAREFKRGCSGMCGVCSGGKNN